MKNMMKLIPCFLFLSLACVMYAEIEESSVEVTSVEESAEASKSKNDCAECAFLRALEINAAMDATFPFLVPATAEESSAAFASFFDENGIFQFPGGIFRGKQAVFEGFLAYAQTPGEMNQHVIVHKTYWDPTTATLVVERTWHATVTVDTDFCGTTVKAGESYAQDDCVVIRFACAKNCDRKKGCVLPGKVVYYNEYFNTAQTVSNFTSMYPAPCARLE
ncbi:MAG TPA: nuclear transport factor 2 family protein [Candidatus Babeliales bacterium]|nr:nuclear transport factor 2 family protein [Candidatus Babeliales bacterium]